jgi:hypothetical protein
VSAPNLRRTLLAAGIVLAVGVGLEGGSRVLDRVRGRPFDPEALRADTRRLCDGLAHESSAFAAPEPDRPADPGTESKILQPYTGWELPSVQRRVALDAKYYAGPRENAFDVCLLGGSSARAFARSGASRLAEAIARNPRVGGRNVRIHDYSCAGYKQPQMSKLLGWLLALGHLPDAVVEIDGAEELELGEKNALAGTNPGYPSIGPWHEAAGEMRSDWEMVEHLHAIRERRERTRAFGEWLLDSGLWRSCFLGRLAELRLRSLEQGMNGAAHELQQYVHDHPGDEFRGPKLDPTTSVADAVGAGWERAVRNLRGICSAEDVPFLLVVRDPGLSERAAELRARGIRVLADPGADEALVDSLATALADDVRR